MQFPLPLLTNSHRVFILSFLSTSNGAGAYTNTLYLELSLWCWRFALDFFDDFTPLLYKLHALMPKRRLFVLVYLTDAYYGVYPFLWGCILREHFGHHSFEAVQLLSIAWRCSHSFLVSSLLDI